MGDAAEDRAKAAELPEGDVVRVLLEQHGRIRELFADVNGADGEHKRHAFDELRALLAVHETAEEMVLRPVTKKADGASVAEARNNEEAEANVVLQELEKMDVAGPDFDAKLASFRKSVDEHAESEERDEFPLILSSCGEEERQKLGKQMLRTESIAPTHPHPSAAGKPAVQYTVGPFASLIDRAKDALKG